MHNTVDALKHITFMHFMVYVCDQLCITGHYSVPDEIMVAEHVLFHTVEQFR